MTFRRRQRWLRRLAFGFAFATALFAGKVSAAWAVVDEGGSGTKIVTAGGWSGSVDAESGIPSSSGIPQGDEQFLKGESIQVIPYLSQGILTEADRAAAAVATAESIHDPYLTDVYVRQGESLGGPDGAQPFSSHDLRGEAIKSQQTVQLMSHRELETLATSRASVPEPFIPGVTDFPKPTVVATATRPDVINYLSHGMAADGEIGARPDNQANRFSHSDVPARPGVGSSGSDVEWNQVLTVGIGGVVLVLGLGLALGYLRRPRLAL